MPITKAVQQALDHISRFNDHCDKVIHLCKEAGVPYDDLIEDKAQAELDWKLLLKANGGEA